MIEAPAVEVILAADVMVAALSRVSPAAVRFPTMPPKTEDPYADTIGAFVSSDGDFALILSDDILEQVATVLTDRLDWGFDETDQAITVLLRIAGACRGGRATPAWSVQLPPLGKAAAEAFRLAASTDIGHPRIVVTDDPGALSLKEWRPTGVPWPAEQAVTVQSPHAFRNFVEKVRWRFRQSR